MSPYPHSPLLGQMMDQPLLISTILLQADRHFGGAEIVSRRVEGDMHRYTYRDCRRRARQLANALAALGVKMGDRVATLAWNGYRHLETYYAASGSGAVLHTINPRLFDQQIVYIANHAEDQYLFFDLTFLPLVESIAAQCATIKGFVLMCDRDRMPQHSGIANLLCYEDLIEAGSADYAWPQFDENAASGLCYTSGTTGHPKGALYSHRSTLLRAYASALPDALNLSAGDVVLPLVPMFHVNAWGLPYTAPIVDDAGAELAWDGKTCGHLMARGAGVVSGYFKHEGGEVLRDGWFPTGDVATISADGYMQITDRSKDVIKSGGEWISSIELENVASAHPAVREAACIGVFHPKWDERPLLVVVRNAGMALTRDELIRSFDGKVAKWWIPDDVAFVDALPVGPTGKVMKNLMRQQFAGHKFG